jgi:Family of unknown function (DUF5994)
MTSASSTIPTSLAVERLSVKSESPATGSVDGAWWPASRDLAVQIPELVAALAARMGPVERVGYNLDAWDAVPRRVRVGGDVVRMDGFRSQPAATLRMLGRRKGLTLLVVPPEADEQAAQRILATASRDGSTEDIDALLSAAAR